MTNIRDIIRHLSGQYHHDIIKVRQHLHTIPELAHEELKTAAFVSEYLSGIGISHTPGIAGHGIVGLIEGKNPGKRTIALRADMDALPIEELNDVSYRSINPGKMHACGHDVHMACLLGASRILFEIGDRFEGTIKLIFQPAEEKVPGGAILMIKEGVLENPKPDSIIAQHVHPPLAAGKVGFKAGPYMASADEIYITIRGKGGHAALPQDTADTILMASHLIMALQQVVSRNADPHTPSVLSFGKITGLGATNVIPDEVNIEGTFRTFDEDWRRYAHARIKEIAQSVCTAMGGIAEVNILTGYPFLVNDSVLTAKSKTLAQEYLGKENVVDLPPRMTAEDFAYYSQQMPGCFYRLGTGNPAKNITSPIHTATFDVDNESIKVGMGLMAWLAVSA